MVGDLGVGLFTSVCPQPEGSGRAWRGEIHSFITNLPDFLDSRTELVPELGRCPGEGNGNPLQYSCLDNPMDRGAWRATVNGVPKSRT